VKSRSEARLDLVLRAVVDDHPAPVVPATADPPRVQSAIAGRSEFTKRREHRRASAGRFEAPAQAFGYGNRAVPKGIHGRLRQVDTLPKLLEEVSSSSQTDGVAILMGSGRFEVKEEALWSLRRPRPSGAPRRLPPGSRRCPCRGRGTLPRQWCDGCGNEISNCATLVNRRIRHWRCCHVPMQNRFVAQKVPFGQAIRRLDSEYACR
jgi:hypothetical protein